jgi:hypothetical protein
MARDHALSDELLKALEEVTAALERHEVQYALIGGMAASNPS